MSNRLITVGLRKLEKLAVRDPHYAGYERRLFGSGWRDNDRDGQNERAETLISAHRPGRENVQLEFATDRERRVVAGRWWCIFSGKWYFDAADLDIDHLVPLANAWYSGAHAWDYDRRVNYANGVGIRSKRRVWLIAVQNSLNREKGAKSPDEWMPPFEKAHVRYALHWIRTKNYWGMSISPAEKAKLREILTNA